MLTLCTPQEGGGKLNFVFNNLSDQVDGRDQWGTSEG